MSEESPPYGNPPACPPGTHAFAHPVVNAAVCHCGAMYARVNGRHVVVSPIERTSAPYGVAPRDEWQRGFGALVDTQRAMVELGHRVAPDGFVEFEGERLQFIAVEYIGGAADGPLWCAIRCEGAGRTRRLYWYDGAVHAEKPTAS